MKKLKWITTLLVIAGVLLGVIGCKDPEIHVHTFATEWTSDASGHWHAATCEHTEEISDYAEHTFGEYVYNNDATTEKDGTKTRECSVCGYEDTVTDEGSKIHVHTFATEWTSDASGHWHVATCEHTEEISDYAEHSFGEYVSNNDATTEKDGTKTRECNVCGYEDTVTDEGSKIHVHTFATEWTSDASGHWHAATCEHTEEKSDYAEHTFGEYVSNNDATTEKDGTKTRECSVCGYEDTVTDEGSKIHVHTFAEAWTYDASGHWHAATCEHTEEISDYAKHSYGTWKVVQEPTDTQAGRNERTCKVCAYIDFVVLQPAPKGFRFVKGTTITGEESWKPSSKVFVSGRSLTIPNLIVSDHEVTRGEYKAVMGRDPSYGSAYDKDGNKLTGDSVSNNPVNWVNWYDAIVYCNKLSMKEKLTPCYTIDSSTNPDDWGEVPYDEEDSSRTTWDAVICNWNANGYRLPTEAEWEWLTRGGDNYSFAGSNIVKDVAWCIDDINFTGTREVKTKAPNGYGLYDMSGNVFEWCWDWSDYGSISDSTAADGGSLGPYRIQRGGSSYFHYSSSQVASRYVGYPVVHSAYCGFRVVRASSN